MGNSRHLKILQQVTSWFLSIWKIIGSMYQPALACHRYLLGKVSLLLSRIRCQLCSCLGSKSFHVSWSQWGFDFCPSEILKKVRLKNIQKSWGGAMAWWLQTWFSEHVPSTSRAIIKTGWTEKGYGGDSRFSFLTEVVEQSGKWSKAGNDYVYAIWQPISYPQVVICQILASRVYRQGYCELQCQMLCTSPCRSSTGIVRILYHKQAAWAQMLNLILQRGVEKDISQNSSHSRKRNMLQVCAGWAICVLLW